MWQLEGTLPLKALLTRINEGTLITISEFPGRFIFFGAVNDKLINNKKLREFLQIEKYDVWNIDIRRLRTDDQKNELLITVRDTTV